MASLYVAYTAKTETGANADGWSTLRDTAEPNSTAEIESICTKIAKLESLQHVIPLWWRGLNHE